MEKADMVLDSKSDARNRMLKRIFGSMRARESNNRVEKIA
jgi:hypothetical protein